MRQFMMNVVGIFLAAACLGVILAWLYLFGWAAFSLVRLGMSILA